MDFCCYLIKVMEPAAGDAMLHVACVFGRHQIVGIAFMFVELVGSFAEYAAMRARAAVHNAFISSVLYIVVAVYLIQTSANTSTSGRRRMDAHRSSVGPFRGIEGPAREEKRVPASISQLQINPLAHFGTHPAQKYSHLGAVPSTQRNQR